MGAMGKSRTDLNQNQLGSSLGHIIKMFQPLTHKILLLILARFSGKTPLCATLELFKLKFKLKESFFAFVIDIFYCDICFTVANNFTVANQLNVNKIFNWFRFCWVFFFYFAVPIKINSDYVYSYRY